MFSKPGMQCKILLLAGLFLVIAGCDRAAESNSAEDQELNDKS